jgi:glycosyltransferase involved in cell wall biosynthesis
MNEEGQLWWLNLAGIEFCLAPLLILRLWGLRPIGWLHNEKSLLFLNAYASLPRRVLCRLRDAIANRMIFGQYHQIVTPSRAAEASLKERLFCGNSSRSGFLYPYLGVEGERQNIHIGRTWSGPIDLWMIGRVEYGHKNNLAGLEVLKYMTERRKDASLTIVGNGPDMERFLSDTKRLGLAQVVHPRDWESNPWESVPRSAIVFIPSRFESFCLVAREAMLRGIRVVLSPLPVFFEWIPSELIARVCTTEAFAEKIEELSVMSREHLLALYSTVLDRYTEEAFATKFMSILPGASGESLRDTTGSSSRGEA